MTDLFSRISNLRRPPLLIRAARAGTGHFDRQRDLKRLIRVAAAPAPSRSIALLLDEEAELEDNRKTKNQSYNLLRHIEVLIAVIAETRLLSSMIEPK